MYVKLQAKLTAKESKYLSNSFLKSVGVNALKHYLKRLWLVAIATILSKTFKIHFLLMSAIAYNWSFFSPNLNKLFGAYRGYHSFLNLASRYFS